MCIFCSMDYTCGWGILCNKGVQIPYFHTYEMQLYPVYTWGGGDSVTAWSLVPVQQVTIVPVPIRSAPAQASDCYPKKGSNLRSSDLFIAWNYPRRYFKRLRLPGGLQTV